MRPWRRNVYALVMAAAAAAVETLIRDKTKNAIKTIPKLRVENDAIKQIKPARGAVVEWWQSTRQYEDRQHAEELRG